MGIGLAIVQKIVHHWYENPVWLSRQPTPNRNYILNIVYKNHKFVWPDPASASLTRSRSATTRDKTSLYNQINNRMKTGHESLCFGPRFRLAPKGFVGYNPLKYYWTGYYFYTLLCVVFYISFVFNILFGYVLFMILWSNLSSVTIWFCSLYKYVKWFKSK